MSAGKSLAALATAALLGACGSLPVSSYYTLKLDAAAAPQPAAGAGLSVMVGPVTIPGLLDRPQWVVQDGPNQLRVLEQQLWAQPLQADVAQAVAQNLNQRFGDIAFADVSGLPSLWPVAPRLRVQLDVLRLESRLAPGLAIDDQYRWAVSCVAGKAPLPVRTGVATIAAPVAMVDAKAAPYPALAQAHARGLLQASQEIAAAVAALGPTCPAP